MDFFFQNDSVENSLICPRTKSASHCLTELFPIHRNKHWTIRRRDDNIVIQWSNRNIFKVDWFYMYSFSLQCKYLQCSCYTNNFPQIELEVRMAGKILEKSQVWRVHFWLIDISEVSQKSWMKFREQIDLLNWISVQS